MHMIFDIDKLKLRARLAGIPLKALCAKAGVSVATPARLKDGRGQVRTLTKLSLALAQLEHERRDHLILVVTQEKEAAI